MPHHPKISPGVSLPKYYAAGSPAFISIASIGRQDHKETFGTWKLQNCVTNWL